MRACSRVIGKVVPAAQPCCARALRVSDETLLASLTKPNVSVLNLRDNSRKPFSGLVIYCRTSHTCKPIGKPENPERVYNNNWIYRAPPPVLRARARLPIRIMYAIINKIYIPFGKRIRFNWIIIITTTRRVRVYCMYHSRIYLTVSALARSRVVCPHTCTRIQTKTHTQTHLLVYIDLYYYGVYYI